MEQHLANFHNLYNCCPWCRVPLSEWILSAANDHRYVCLRKKFLRQDLVIDLPDLVEIGDPAPRSQLESTNFTLARKVEELDEQLARVQFGRNLCILLSFALLLIVIVLLK